MSPERNSSPLPVPSNVRIKYKHWYFRMPWMRPYRGMVIGRTVILRHGKDIVPVSLLAHELAHVEQMNRYGVFRFYLNYLGHYFWGLLKFRSHRQAYFRHPYEVEARTHESKFSGLSDGLS